MHKAFSIGLFVNSIIHLAIIQVFFFKIPDWTFEEDSLAIHTH